MENLKPKHLRLVQAGYETYTGPIGAYEFEDGFSVEALPLIARDRLAAAFQMVEVQEDGSELTAGAPARMLRDASNKIEPTAPLPRMTIEARAEEDLRAILGSEKVRPMRSRANLEAVGDKMGIAGVRLIADDWGVRNKALATLIDMVVGAQATYANRRIADLASKGVSKDELAVLFAPKNDLPMPVHPMDAKRQAELATKPVDTPQAEASPEPILEPVPVPDLKSTIVEQAASGDMAAAVSAGE